MLTFTTTPPSSRHKTHARSVNGNDPHSGEKRARGLEWNTFGEVARGVRLLGGAAYTRACNQTANSTYNGMPPSAVRAAALGMEGVPLRPDAQQSHRGQFKPIPQCGQHTDIAPGRAGSGCTLRHENQRHGCARLNIANALNRRYSRGFSAIPHPSPAGQGRTVSASVTVISDAAGTRAADLPRMSCSTPVPGFFVPHNPITRCSFSCSSAWPPSPCCLSSIAATNQHGSPPHAPLARTATAMVLCLLLGLVHSLQRTRRPSYSARYAGVCHASLY